MSSRRYEAYCAFESVSNTSRYTKSWKLGTTDRSKPRALDGTPRMPKLRMKLPPAEKARQAKSLGWVGWAGLRGGADRYATTGSGMGMSSKSGSSDSSRGS